MLNEIATKRIQKEIIDLERDPPPGITCYPKDDTITDLEAYIKGPPDSPYEAGLFKLSIQIPDRYPFQPPQMKFITSIYHPNIDDTGRICADILKMGDKGEWKPAINLSTALTSLRQLLAAPNPDDPLDVDIAREYQLDYPTFFKNAQDFTTKYASEEIVMNDESNKSETEDSMNVIESEEEEEEEKIKKPKMSLSLSKKKSNMSQEDSNDILSKKETKIELKEKIDETKVIKNTKSEKFEKKTKTERVKMPMDKAHKTIECHNTDKLCDKKTEKKKQEAQKLKNKKQEITEMVEFISLCEKDTIDITIPNITKKSPEKKTIDSVTDTSLSIKRHHGNSLVNGRSKKLKTLVDHSHQQKEPSPYFSIEQEKTERKPLDSKFFDQNIIILSDDDDIEYDKPVLHSLQLSKKTNRNKLSLSKKRHP